MTYRSIAESFSAKEIQEHSPRVIERVRKEIIVLLAGEAATKLIRERADDPRAQRDQSAIRLALRDFPELASPAMQEQFTNAATEAVTMHRADIEKLADVLVERRYLTADQVRHLVGDR